MQRPDDSAPGAPAPRGRRARSSDIRTMETILLASTAALLAAVAWPIASHWREPPAAAAVAPTEAVVLPPTRVDAVAVRPTIQVALLLDTSDSMDGLIDQARTRLWSVVNSLDSVTFHGERPQLEVALYEYGNDAVSPLSGYVRQVSGFTAELDRVSAALFELDTDGGSEHAPQAIVRALDELPWKQGDGVLRVVYLAGNEEFQQGPVPWADAADRARAGGVVVNTIFCGAEASGISGGWRDAATRNGGRFFAIDADVRRVDPPTPFDDDIAALGVAINETYVGYGEMGRAGLENQRAQDDNNMHAGSAVLRGLSKTKDYYRNPSWDLVDGVDEGTVDLHAIDRSSLPAALQSLEADALAAYVAARKAERSAIAARAAELEQQRTAFLREHAAAHPDAAAVSLDDAMISALGAQAEAAGFTLVRS
jgi:hypothetical protein